MLVKWSRLGARILALAVLGMAAAPFALASEPEVVKGHFVVTWERSTGTEGWLLQAEADIEEIRFLPRTVLLLGDDGGRALAREQIRNLRWSRHIASDRNDETLNELPLTERARQVILAASRAAVVGDFGAFLPWVADDRGKAGMLVFPGAPGETAQAMKVRRSYWESSSRLQPLVEIHRCRNSVRLRPVEEASNEAEVVVHGTLVGRPFDGKLISFRVEGAPLLDEKQRMVQFLQIDERLYWIPWGW